MVRITTSIQPNIAQTVLNISTELLLFAIASLKPANNSNSVLIHSALADGGLWPHKNSKGQIQGQLSIQLYYYLRSLDPNGSGKAILDLAQCAEILGISIYSVRRRVTWGLRLGLFRSSRPAGVNRKEIYYYSLSNICQALNISELGALVEIPASDIPKIKFFAAEAEALRLQNQSRWKEERKRKKRKLGRLLDPDKLIASELCNGVILFKKGRVTFLKRSHPAYGGSQKRLAWELGRHPSTIQRRLGDSYRQAHGLEPVPKTQLAVAPNYDIQQFEGKTPPIKRLKPGQNIISIRGYGRFRLATNVYSSPLELQPRRTLRGKIKRHAEMGRILDNWRDNWREEPEYSAMLAAWRQSIDKGSLSIEKIEPAGQGGWRDK